jgi:HK97 family phage major capsid protein
MSEISITKQQKKRAELVAELEAIGKIAEKRKLTEKEQDEFDEVVKAIDQIDVLIKEAKKGTFNKLSTDKMKEDIFSDDPFDTEKKDVRFLDRKKTIALIDSKTRLKNSLVKEELSLGELIVAKIRGPQNEVERKALDTSLDASGGISTSVNRNFWDYARSASTVIRAGATTLDFQDDSHGNVVIPQITGSITPEWKVQNENVTLSDPTFSPRTFDFKTLYAGTKISNELAQDSEILGAMITQDLSRSFASEIDRAALLGSGSGEEPRGVFNTSNVNVFAMGSNGGALADFNPLVGGVRMLLDDNTDMERISGFIMAPRTWEELAVLKSAVELQQLMPPTQLSNIPYFVSSKIPVDQTVGSSDDCSTIFVADWSQLVIGIRLGIKVRFHEQTFAQSYSTLVTCAARVDFQLMNPSNFCKIVGVTPGGALT